MSDKITVITSNEHREAVDKLVADPILQDMLIGLRNVPDAEIMHEDGQPRWEFIGAANERYEREGGQHGAFIGSVAHAIIRIRKERGRCHFPAWAEPYIVFIEQGDRLKLLFENEELDMVGIRQHHPTGLDQFNLLQTLREAGKLK